MFTFPALNVGYLLLDSNPLPPLLNSFHIKDANLAYIWSKALQWTPVVFVYLVSFSSLDWTAPPCATTSLGKCSPLTQAPWLCLHSLPPAVPPVSPKVWVCDPGLTHHRTPSFLLTGTSQGGQVTQTEVNALPKDFVMWSQGKEEHARGQGREHSPEKHVSRNCHAIKRENKRESSQK